MNQAATVSAVYAKYRDALSALDRELLTENDYNRFVELMRIIVIKLENRKGILSEKGIRLKEFYENNEEKRGKAS